MARAEIPEMTCAESILGGEEKILCRVCGAETSSSEEESIEGWKLHTYGFQAGQLQIWACPRCSGLHQWDIFAGFQKRVREGLDVYYH